MRRIEEVEKDLKALADSTAGKEDLQRVRGEMKKLVVCILASIELFGHVKVSFPGWPSYRYEL